MHNGNPRGGRAIRRALRTGSVAGAALVVGLSLFGAIAPPATASELLSESFAGPATESDAWSMISPKGKHTPCLTGATKDGVLPVCNAVKDGSEKPDPEGEGAFQITNNAPQEAGALLLNKAIPAGKGLHIEFDMYQYKAKQFQGKGGDGISFFLVDGETPEVEPGEPGGSLAYKGLKGGIIGLGFDEFGNFSNPQWGGEGGPGVKPNSLVVRGAEESGYAYLDGKEVEGSLAVDEATDRKQAKRHVIIDLSPDNWLTVAMDFGDGPQVVMQDLDLDSIEGQPKLPQSLKLGFAASTGKATAYHEISGFKAATLDPNLAIKVSGDKTMQAGGTGKVRLNVSNAKSASATKGPVKVVYDAPEGTAITGASGDGWDCQVTQDSPVQATCTREDVLKPGEEYPPIDVTLKPMSGASGSATGTAQVDLVDGEDSDEEDNKATHEIEIEGDPYEPPPPYEGPGPDLSMSADDVTIQAGETATVPVTVSNADAAGPTTSTVSFAYQVGEGLEIISAAGDGWRCEVDGQIATCTRPGTGEDALDGGESYPPVNIEIKAPDGSSGVVGTSGGVTTAGDTDTSNNTTTGQVTVEGGPYAGGGELGVDVTSEPNPYQPGKPFGYTVTFSNTGDSPVENAQIIANFPEMWEGVKWTCKGTGCPAPEGLGDIDGTVSLAPGESVTFTVRCQMPESAYQVFKAMAEITAEGTNCAAKGDCTDEDTNPSDGGGEPSYDGGDEPSYDGGGEPAYDVEPAYQ